MSTSQPARKRTQFASFLTDAAADLSGFGQPAMGRDDTAEDQELSAPSPPEGSEVAELSAPPEPEARSTSKPTTNEPSATVADRSTSVRPRKTLPSRQAVGSKPTPAGQTEETIKVSVKIDPGTFLALKRALELRETLQEFCLNAIKNELAARTGPT